MGKKCEFYIDSFFYEKIMKPIRKKEDAIILLLDIIRSIPYLRTIERVDAKGGITVKIEKMNRMFFNTESKIFSLCIPFFINCENETHETRSVNSFFSAEMDGIELDGSIISLLISIFSIENEPFFYFNEIDTLLYFIEEKIDEFELTHTPEEIWGIVKKIMLWETGYIRFDCDEKNEKENHPLYHLDIFFMQNSTFKLGLNKEMKIDKFVDMLDTTKKCCTLVF